MPTTKQKGMSTAKRDRLPESAFAFPEQRKEPLNDARHVRNAIARFDQVEGVSDADRDEAWKRIKKVREKAWRRDRSRRLAQPDEEEVTTRRRDLLIRAGRRCRRADRPHEGVSPGR